MTLFVIVLLIFSPIVISKELSPDSSKSEVSKREPTKYGDK